MMEYKRSPFKDVYLKYVPPEDNTLLYGYNSTPTLIGY